MIWPYYRWRIWVRQILHVSHSYRSWVQCDILHIVYAVSGTRYLTFVHVFNFCRRYFDELGFSLALQMNGWNYSIKELL